MSQQNSNPPLYQQLNRTLKELIRRGEFKAGGQFLSERDICERYGVSRATANKSLSNLVAEGILEFKKGIGTFVRGGTLDYDLRSLVSFTGKALAAGRRPSTRVIHFKTLPCREAGDLDMIQKLKLAKGDKLHYMERLRLADDIPVILEYRHVVEKLVPSLTASEAAGSLYALWVEKYKLDIIGADQIIRAILISGRDAALMGLPEGSAGLVVLSIGFLRGRIPLWWEKTLYRGDSYEFHNRLGPVRTARPAAGSLIPWEEKY